MTPAEFRVARDKLGLSQARLARALGVSLQTIKAWEGDVNRITGPAALVMELSEYPAIRKLLLKRLKK